METRDHGDPVTLVRYKIQGTRVIILVPYRRIYMVCVWYYIPTRAVVNMARGGEGRCLDHFTDRIQSLHIDIVYLYIPQMKTKFSNWQRN